MNSAVTLDIEQARELAMAAMLGRGFGRSEASATVEALLAAECDELPSHGLSRLPFYLDQAACEKVVASAIPSVEVDDAVIRVDARFGLAFPAVKVGLEAAYGSIAKHGIVAVSIANSHHLGVAGAPVEHAARRGYVALAFSNAPSAMAPWGGNRPLYGTNPIAFACPRDGKDPLLIDLSLSKVARGKVMLARKQGVPIPEGWAKDAQGQPTTDPDEAIAGSMVPAGDAKGAALALMVELLAAGLAGSHFGFQASSFLDAEGEPPGIGQLILLLDPGRFTAGFEQHVEQLFSAIEDQPGARLPGERRYQLRRESDRRVSLSAELVAELEAHASAAQ